MSRTEVLVHQDAGELAADATSRLLARLEEVQASGRLAHVVLTGGSIADQIHQEVARRAPESGVDWGRVVLWWGDERFVASGSGDRNAWQAREAMLSSLPLLPEHVHEVPSTDDAPDAAAAAAAYADELLRSGPDVFDVVMLGIGPDGHVASLFPGRPQLDEAERSTVAVTDSPKPPPERVSLTLPVLNRAEAVWFVASGLGKAEAVRDSMSSGPVDQCPARGVRGRTETLWLLDEAAASAR